MDRRHRVPALILALALIVRIAYLLEIDDSPLFEYPPVDGLTYVQHAQRIADGNWLGFGEEPFWQPPLYTYCLAVLRTLLPSDGFFYAIRAFNIFLGSLTCLLIWHLGCRLFNPVVGITAAIAAAVYGPFIFFDGEVLPATLGTFLDLAGLILLLRCLERPTARGFLVAGIVFGLASLTIATVLTFVVTAAIFIWVMSERQHTSVVARLREPGVFLLGVVLVISPVTLRNIVISGDTVLISSNAGVNFYVGNNGSYDDTVNIRPGWEWDELLEQPRVESGIRLASAKSGFFLAKAREFIGSQPLDYLALQAKKSFLFWHGDEIGRNQGIYFWRNYSSVLSATLWKWGIAFPFGIAAPLALLGCLLRFRRDGFSLPLLFVVVYGLSVIAFFISSRYRIPLMPLLLIYASYGAQAIVSSFREGRQRVASFCTALLALFLVTSNFRVGEMDLAGDAAIHFNLGVAHAVEKDTAAARKEYEFAVARDSTHVQAWFNLGSIRAVQGDFREAIAIFERVLQEVPERVVAWVSLARTRRSVGDRAGALEAYERGLAIDPRAFNYFGRYAELIDLYVRGREYEEVERVLEVASRYHPEEARRLRRALRRARGR